MRICILGNAQSKHISRWAEYFTGKGHSVDVVSARPAEVPGARVHVPRIPFESYLRGRRRATFDADRSGYLAVYLSYLWLLFSLRGMLRRLRPDLLMAMTLETNGTLSWVSGFHPRALWHLGCTAISIRSETSLLVRLLVKTMIRTTDAIYTSDPAAVARLRELGARPEQIRIHPWGVELEQFRPERRCASLRAELGAEGRPLVICARTLLPEHDLGAFLLAARRVVDRRPDARFVLLGDGPERPRVERLRAELGLEEEVALVGYQPYGELARWLATADIYVDPLNWRLPGGRSWWGHRRRCSMAGTGYSVTLEAAMSCGCAPVVTDRPEVRELIPARYHGSLFPPGDPGRCAGAILDLLERPADLEAYRADCRRIAEERFDWERNCRRTEMEYAELVAGSAGRG